MTVGRLCVREVDIATSDETAQVAAQRMHSRNVGTLVIVDDAQHPIGLITDRDLTVRVLAEGRDGAQVLLQDVMTTGVRTVDEDCPVEAALEAMRAGPFRRVPVVNKKSELVGLISIDDVLDLLAEEFQSIGSLLARESPKTLAAT